jgi:hypothetical protein
MEVIESFVVLLESLSPCFTLPTFSTFALIMTGWALSSRHRYITDAIITTGSTRQGHHSNFHRFFSQAAWSLDQVSFAVTLLLLRYFVPHGVIHVAVDDTLRRKRGLSLFGAGMHYDPLMSSRSKRIVNWGHCWVVVSLVVGDFPWAPGKYWSLPILFRLYRNLQGKTKGKKSTKVVTGSPKGGPGPTRKVDVKAAVELTPTSPHRTKPELAVELIKLLASWLPERHFLLTGDSAYGGASVAKHLPTNVNLISRAHAKAILYTVAPLPEPGKKGRHRKRGDRLPTIKDWANDTTRPWQPLSFKQYGLHAEILVKTCQALYYTTAGQRLVTIVLSRDTVGGRPDQVFYCTDLNLTARDILSAYATRWSIEVTFENSKQLLGFGDAANRLPLAVERTAPMSMILYSLIVLWFHREGYQFVQFPDRPWYTRKSLPSFADMLSTLRRESLLKQFRRVLKNNRVDETQFAQLVEILTLAG